MLSKMYITAQAECNTMCMTQRKRGKEDLFLVLTKKKIKSVLFFFPENSVAENLFSFSVQGDFQLFFIRTSQKNMNYKISCRQHLAVVSIYFKSFSQMVDRGAG